jgi:hypothetical protein
MSNYHQRRLDGAIRYAAADKSDPFALARALTHLSNGICSRAEDGTPGHYDAEKGVETRYLPLSEGQETPESYVVDSYSRKVRP